MRMIISRSRTPLNSSKTCGAFADLRMVGRRRQLAPEDAECPWRQLGGFHHPHLRGTTVHDWPLNVFSEEDASAQLPILRAIASSDLHNLVFRADYRIV